MTMTDELATPVTERRPMPEPEVTAPVREAGEVHADMIEAAQAEADADGLYVEFGGVRVKARGNRPAGAFAVMCARLKSANPATQTAAPLMLLQAWIVEEDHDKMFDAIGEVPDLEAWMGGDFKTAVEALAQRPSPAP